MALCLRCQARSSTTLAPASPLRLAVPIGPATGARRARTVVFDDQLRTREGSTWQTQLIAWPEPLGRCARPVRHTRRQLVAIACRKRGAPPKVKPSMTSRRRATQEIHRERYPAIHPLHLHDLPGRVLRLRLPERPQPVRSRGRHPGRVCLRRSVPVRPELRLRQGLIRALLTAVSAARCNPPSAPHGPGPPFNFRKSP